MILVFGDSFAKIFTLIKDNIIKVHSFKGATLKGITKPDNENRKEIEQILLKKKNIKYAIFVFGQVDINLSFYYDKCHSKNKSENKNIFSSYNSDILKNYVNWISNLPGNFKRIILGAYPSPLDQEYTIYSLINYGSLNKEEVNNNLELLKYYSSDLLRKTRYFEFIYLLKFYCNSLKLTNKNHNSVEYFDINEYLLDENLDIKDEYIDISKYNMHIRWEPIIPFLIKKLNDLCINISEKDIVDNIDEIESKYLKRKTQIINDRQYLERFL